MNALFKLTLKSTAIGALTFFAAAAGCSSSTDDTPGAGGDSGTTGGTNDAGKSSTTAGKSNGGDSAGGAKTSNGGAAEGGAAEGGASNGGAPEIGHGGESPLNFGGESAGGAGPVGTGPAVAKFCNTLTFGGDPTTMILEVGEGAAMVTFTAVSGTCVPADGVMCKEIPVGDDVLVQMFDEQAPTTALDFAGIEVLPGQDLIFYTSVDDGQPIWNASTIKASTGLTCEDIVYNDVLE